MNIKNNNNKTIKFKPSVANFKRRKQNFTIQIGWLITYNKQWGGSKWLKLPAMIKTFLNFHTLSIMGILSFFSSTSKSSTRSLVSSVPLRDPTAHTSLVLLVLTRHTTPPLPPLSRVTRLRRNSPDFKSQIFTVPSSDEVITNFLLNCKQVTALWCLLDPALDRNTWTSGC